MTNSILPEKNIYHCKYILVQTVNMCHNRCLHIVIFITADLLMVVDKCIWLHINVVCLCPNRLTVLIVSWLLLQNI